MVEATVLGAPRSSAERIARRLADVLGTSVVVGDDADARPGGIRLAWPPPAEADEAGMLVFVDDRPARPDDGSRGEALAALAGARARGCAIRVAFNERAARHWVRDVADSGLPAAEGPLQKVYLAAGQSEASTDLARRLSQSLGLPLIQPEAENPGHEYEGWGPRYEALARGESWLIHSPTWHAVEALSESADLVILIEQTVRRAGEEFPAPRPGAKKWQRIFAPWLNRYPGIEARLLEREMERHATAAPVLRVRTAEEQAAIVAALSRSTEVRTG